MAFLKSLVLKILGIAITIYAAYYAWENYEFVSGMILATVLFAVGGVTYSFSSTSTYNKIATSVKAVANPNKVSIEELYEVFKDMDSTMGKPWIGKVKTVPGKCLIFGPNANDDFLYVRKLFGSFYITVSQHAYFFDTPENKEQIKRHKKKRHAPEDLSTKEDILCYSLLDQTLPEDLADIFKAYLQKNEILPFPTAKNKGKLYQFDQKFKVTGQKFCLLDMKRKPLYVLESSFPLIHFSVQEYNTGKEVLSMQKKIFAFMSTYTFTVNGEEYGIFKQKLNFIRDTFEMDTKDGKLSMYHINDKVGTNYMVKMDNKVIGSIADRFNITLRNAVFDNFVIHVREDKYTALLAGLTVMAVREKARDKAGSPL